MPPIALIVGLGNPGSEYERTRHNAGFWLADAFAADLGATFQHEKAFAGFVAKAKAGGRQVLIAKPQTFMNRSGQSVGAIARFYKLPVESLLVMHDELDLMPGQVKLKLGGGHAGHNGLRDIQSAMGSPNFWRLRLGIGHPRTLGLQQQVADFVLHPARRDEQSQMDEALVRCRQVLPLMIDGQMDRAIAQLHRDNPA